MKVVDGQPWITMDFTGNGIPETILTKWKREKNNNDCNKWTYGTGGRDKGGSVLIDFPPLPWEICPVKVGWPNFKQGKTAFSLSHSSLSPLFFSYTNNFT